MVLDTGATRHVLADWAAREAGVATQASKVDLADHTGKRLPVLEADASALRISGWGQLARSPSLLVGSLPDALRRLGIAGIVAPQLLGGDGAVVLDMPKGEMIAMSRDAARDAYATAGKELARAGALRTCVTTGGGTLFVARAQVGGQPAELQLDTGAADSDLKEGSPPARRLAGRAVSGEKIHTAAGTFVARKLAGVRVVVGEVAVDTDVMLAPAEPRPTCPRDGFLGMDVLHDTVVVLAAEKSFVRWMPR
jgi:predicted aspartyl protease